MSNQLSKVKMCRLFNVIDDFNREGLALDASLPDERMIRLLKNIKEWQENPKQLRCGNSSEYVTHNLLYGLKKWH